MGLQGRFVKMPCKRVGGKMWSFILENTNWISKETVNVGIFPSNGQQPWFWKGQVIESGASLVFNYDTANWYFCQGDTVALLDDRGNVEQKWVLRLREYGPGECPECHGTHKCRKCNGTGYIFPQRGDEIYTKCPDCDGLGVCQTCYIPTRSNPTYRPTYNATPTAGGNANVAASRARQIETLRRRIYDLQAKIDRIEYDERMRKLRSSIHGVDTSMTTLYMQQAQLKYTYQTQLIQLQSQLDQLENQGF